MHDIFTKFYSEHIKEIHDFLGSDSDILYISGYSGSGKSSVLKSALETYDKDVLRFHHLCFKGTVIDDFLLSFYDSFRNHAIKQRIILKKNPEEGFMQKVNFYFKNLEYPAVVIIDNFEIISDDSEITDFLLHISNFENVKIIVVSKNPTCRLAENPTVGIEKITFDKINFFEFENLLSETFPDIKSSLFQELYDFCDGYELYLKMVLNYLESVNITLEEFLSEFKEKQIPFEDYIIEKQISLIPNTYFPLLENLSYIHHNVPSVFLEAYSLGDSKLLPYLLSKYAISSFFETYYIKSYLRKYFAESLSLQNKVKICSTLISIYENELKKSPKDRILRLSRESIRKQIALLEEKSPKVARMDGAPSFNYVAQVITNNPQWFVTGGGANAGGNFAALKRKAKEAKEIKKQKEEELSAAEPSQFEVKLAQAIELENNYRFKEASLLLDELKPLAKKLPDKMTVYSKLAYNCLKLNDNNAALSNLRELSEICINAGDFDSYAKYRIEIGKIYKKLYAFSRAKTCFEEIIQKQNDISERTLATARFALGEIYELENNFDAAIKEYKAAHDLISNENENDILLPEICFRTASLYDENAYYEEALLEYRNSIQYAENSGNDIYLTKCYTNSGVILADMGETDDALSYLEYSLELSKNSQNYIDTYYIARNIAELYKNTEPEKAYDYLMMALDYAKLSDNSFEMAISLLEIGDYYYDLKQNEQALICYFQAKATLGPNASKENLERVTTRINDMKIKLGDYVFRGMQQLYDSN